jgi:hypothetical protein
MVISLGEYGFCLGPTNLQKTRWERDGQPGTAQYQYIAADIAHFVGQFGLLQQEFNQLAAEIQAFNSAV